MFILVLLSAAAAAPTLSQFQQMTPERAGTLLLGDRAKAPVIIVRPNDQPGPTPPGLVEYDLIETPRPVEGGCERQRWIAKFFRHPQAESADAAFTDAYAQREVAIPIGSGCFDANYLVLRSNVRSERALRSLRLFHRVATGALSVTFSCASELPGPLCASPSHTRAGLNEWIPWAIDDSGTMTEIWMRRPGDARGGPVMIVRFATDAEQPDHVWVQGKIPAPF